MSNVLINSLASIGDNFYLRPFVKGLAERGGYEFFINTPWPEVFHDVPNLHFVEPRGRHYTKIQRDSIARWKLSNVFEPPPRGAVALRLHYLNPGSTHISNGLTIIESLRRQSGVSDIDFSYPLPPGASDVEQWLEADGIEMGNYAIIRYPTIRPAWVCTSRNPEPGVLASLARFLMAEGVQVLSVADVREDESFVEEDRPATFSFERGQLPLPTLLYFLQNARVCIGSPGLFCPIVCALSGAQFTVFGHHVSPATIFDPRMNVGGRVEWIEPANPVYDLSLECSESRRPAEDPVVVFEKYYRSLGDW